MRDELALEDVVEEFVDKVAGEFGAELGEEFARIGKVVSDQGNKVLDVVCDGRHIAALVAYY